MKRRDFLKQSLAATALTGLSACSTTGEGKGHHGKAGTKQEYYEFRAYRLKAGADTALIDTFLEKAAIPAWNRLGCCPVGVFKEIEPKETASVFVIVPHASVGSYACVAAQLKSDAEYQAAGAAYLQAPKSGPAYQRIDSWLLKAFAGQPRIFVPDYSKARGPRVFELRTYESFSESKAAKKVEMFNAGEVQTMHEVGLAPIFFGEGLLGPNLPHLTYMTSGPDLKTHQAHWDAFGKHPTWVKLKDDPQYADTVSKMTKWMLKPADYSQI